MEAAIKLFPGQLLRADQSFVLGDIRVELFHCESDQPYANRIKIADGLNLYELLPSKGLSVGQVVINGRRVFWEQPSSLLDPHNLDLYSHDLYINGKPAPGFMYIATYTGGIELLGLSNWGMPKGNPGDSGFKILHGEASSIPVERVEITAGDDRIFIEGTFFTRTFAGDESLPWYQRGEKVFMVTRKMEICRATGRMSFTDSFENVTKEAVTPDWGYHITFYPEKGARLIVPAHRVEGRGGSLIPENFTTWQPSPDPGVRIETGIIFSRMLNDSSGFVRSMVCYPDGAVIEVKTEPAPYFQSWLCAGGAGSKEFTWPDGTPVLKKNWDGIGIEFGASALDHDGNSDPDVAAEGKLLPGQVRTIQYSVELITPNQAEKAGFGN